MPRTLPGDRQVQERLCSHFTDVPGGWDMPIKEGTYRALSAAKAIKDWHARLNGGRMARDKILATKALERIGDLPCPTSRSLSTEKQPYQRGPQHDVVRKSPTSSPVS